jgi:hypothetical protein
MVIRKNIFPKHEKRTGSLSIEMMVAVGVMAVLIGVLAGVGGTLKKINDQRWLRYTMLAAGQAQMDAIAVTGNPIDKETFTRLWPNVTCKVEVTEAGGQWQGLKKVQLNLSAKSRQKTIETSLVRYVPSEWNAGILPALPQARAGSPRSIGYVPSDKESRQ